MSKLYLFVGGTLDGQMMNASDNGYSHKVNDNGYESFEHYKPLEVNVGCCDPYTIMAESSMTHLHIQAMFFSGYIESRQQRLNIEQVTPDTSKGMLPIEHVSKGLSSGKIKQGSTQPSSPVKPLPCEEIDRLPPFNIILIHIMIWTLLIIFVIMLSFIITLIWHVVFR